MRSCLFLLFAALPLAAQTDGDLKPLFEAYAKERAAAKGLAETLEQADKLAARAADARKGENYAAASRLIRDARWTLPAAPADLPEGARILGYSRLRHGERANSIRYNADGTLLLTASGDRTARVWSVATGREILVYRGHLPQPNESVLKVADAVFLPDGERVASGGSREIHIWELKTGKKLSTLVPEAVEGKKELARNVNSLAVSDDGKFLAAGYDDKVLRVWNLETGKESYASQPQGRIENIAWQPKGKHVAAVDLEGFLAVYNPFGESKTPVVKLQVTDGGNASAYSVRFTPDGTKIVTGGQDKMPRLIPAPAADGTAPPNLAAAMQKLPAHKEDVRAVGISPDGKYIFSGGKDNAVRVVDALGQIVRSFTAPDSVRCLAVRPDGLQVAAACDDGNVRVWDFLAVDDHRSATEAKEPLWVTAVNADGTAFAAAGADKAIRVYSLNGTLQQTLEGSTAPVTSLVFLSDNKLLSAGGDKVLRLWDAKAGKSLGEWPGHAAAVLALAATPDGKLAISGAADKVVNGWDAATGKVLWTWNARSAVSALAISKDGARVYVGSADGGLAVLTIAGDKATVSAYVNAHVSGVAALALNADGTRLASAGGDGIPKIWRLEEKGPPTTLHRMSPALEATTPTPVALSAIAYSPDGRLVAAGGADKIVRLYDTNTGQEHRSLRGCTDWVTSLAFAANGEKLVAVGADHAARVFDVVRADAGQSAGHAGSFNAVAFRKDGKLLAGVGAGKSIRFWDPATGADAGVILGPDDKSFLREKFYSVGFAGDALVAGGSGKILRFWSVGSKKPLTSTAMLEIYGITPAADGQTVGVWGFGGDQNSYAIYAVPKEPAAKLEPKSSMVERGRKVYAAAFAPSLALVASGDDKGQVILHDLAAKATVGKEWPILTKRCKDLGFSPDGKLLLAMDVDGNVVLANVESREKVAEAKGPKEGVAGLIISPAGDRFAILGDETAVVQFFDYAGKSLKTVTLPSPARGAAFSADGKMFATAHGDGCVVILDAP